MTTNVFPDNLLLYQIKTKRCHLNEQYLYWSRWRWRVQVLPLLPGANGCQSRQVGLPLSHLSQLLLLHLHTRKHTHNKMSINHKHSDRNLHSALHLPSYLFSLLLQTQLLRILLSSSRLKSQNEITIDIFQCHCPSGPNTYRSSVCVKLQKCSRWNICLLKSCFYDYNRCSGIFSNDYVSCYYRKKSHSVVWQRCCTLAAFRRISLSCSSFRCFSNWSSCSKNFSWARTSLICSQLSSSCQQAVWLRCYARKQRIMRN